ncbi:arginine--tRNA ligase [Candidatus Gracilibacteria bacterium]|nr:arginine--tRNA ligase [Candidatus Gracilibacteria bacterium]
MVDELVVTPETAESAEETETVDLREINAALQTDLLTLVTQKESQATVQEHHRLDSYALGRAKTRIKIFLHNRGKAAFRRTPDSVTADYSIMVPDLTKADPKELEAAEGKKAKKALGSEAMNNYRTKILPALAAELSAQFPWATFEIQEIYINMTLEKGPFLDATLQQVHQLDEEYGNNESQAGQRTLLDFSSPNIAKTMHVGHLRSTIIGEVLKHILEANGSITYGVNHLGDWGTNFGQIIHAQELWGEETAELFDPETQPMEYLAELYKRMKTAIGDKETDGQKAMDQESRTRFTRLEQLDPEMLKHWQEFRRLSFIEFDRMYQRLDISFDASLGESFYNDQMAAPVEELAEQGISEKIKDGRTVVRLKKEEEEGTESLETIEGDNNIEIIIGQFQAKFEVKGKIHILRNKKNRIIVRIDNDATLIHHGNSHEEPEGEVKKEKRSKTIGAFKKGLRLQDAKIKIGEKEYPSPLLEIDQDKMHVILKSDGSTMYLTRDIAALRHRVESWKATKMLYVIGNEQESDMEALYHISAKLGDTEPGEAEHLAFGMITKEGKKISSREGAGSLEGLIDQLKEAALANLKKREHSAPETIEEDAEKIATGALIYGNFAASMSKNMEFDLKKMLSLEGQSGPYLQYSAVRLTRLLEKMKEIESPAQSSTEFLTELDPKATKLVKMMAEFPEQLAQVGKLNAPHLLASFLYEFCSSFNSLYSGEIKFTKLDIATQAEYKYLFEATLIVLKRGLDLLHIQIPNQMGKCQNYTESDR